MNFEKLHNYMTQAVPSKLIPGCDLIIYHKGEQVYREQFGTGDYLRSKPVDPNATYILYSCTKVITCAAVLHLIEEGKLGLDDPVANYLPAFAEVTLKDGSKPKTTMTVRHLFTMTGGLNYDRETPHILDLLNKDPNADTVAVANAIAKTPLSFEPGSHYQYSLCHDVLAAVAEVVTGKSFEQYVREWSGYHVDFHFTDENRRTLSPQFNAISGEAVPMSQSCSYILSPKHDSGGAGMITTAETYTRLISDICCAKLLSRESLELMTTNQLHSVALDEMHGAETKHPYGYGLGVRTLMTPEFARFKAPLREFGWGGAAGSYAVLDYERQLAVGYFQCVLNRPADAPNVYREIRNLAYECLGYTFGEE